MVELLVLSLRGQQPSARVIATVADGVVVILIAEMDYTVGQQHKPPALQQMDNLMVDVHRADANGSEDQVVLARVAAVDHRLQLTASVRGVRHVMPLATKLIQSQLLLQTGERLVLWLMEPKAVAAVPAAGVAAAETHGLAHLQQHRVFSAVVGIALSGGLHIYQVVVN